MRSESTPLLDADDDSRLDHFWRKVLPPVFAREAVAADAHLREGRFQRSLSLLAGASSVLAGLEVSYEHYRGSYGQKIMWTPVILSGAMTGAGVWGFFNTWAARTVLRWTSVATLLDSVVGFYYHVRGVARKPGGWRLVVENIVMGPPLFAPLLFGVSAYLGLLASFLRPENSRVIDLSLDDSGTWTADLRHGRFQKHLAVATIFATFFSGAEALYSHYKTRFKYKSQWTPVIISPLLMGAAALSIRSPWAGRTLLPAISTLAIADGAVGFYYHAKGVLKRPGGIKKPFYNILYGPPIFAPLLFAACGAIGLLACFMRREKK